MEKIFCHTEKLPPAWKLNRKIGNNGTESRVEDALKGFFKTMCDASFVLFFNLKSGNECVSDEIKL